MTQNIAGNDSRYAATKRSIGLWEKYYLSSDPNYSENGKRSNKKATNTIYVAKAVTPADITYQIGVRDSLDPWNICGNLASEPSVGCHSIYQRHHRDAR